MGGNSQMARKRTFGKFGNLLINLDLSFISLIVLLILLEIGFRLVETLNAEKLKAEGSWAIYDEELGYRLRSNYADYNSDGLRDDPIDPVKTDFRILMLGDSVAFYGDTIEDTYVGHLETKLNQDPDLLPVEV